MCINKLVSHGFIQLAFITNLISLSVGITNAENLSEVEVRNLESYKGQPAVSADIDKLSWMVGQWRGQLPNGATMEHLIPSPMHGQLPGLVRFYKDSIWLNEITLFAERDDSLVYMVRHFNTEFIAQEPVNKPKTHALLDIENNIYYFDGVTFVFESPDSHSVYYETINEQQRKTVLKVNMHRIEASVFDPVNK